METGLLQKRSSLGEVRPSIVSRKVRSPSGSHNLEADCYSFQAVEDMGPEQEVSTPWGIWHPEGQGVQEAWGASI